MISECRVTGRLCRKRVSSNNKKNASRPSRGKKRSKRQPPAPVRIAVRQRPQLVRIAAVRQLRQQPRHHVRQVDGAVRIGRGAAFPFRGTPTPIRRRATGVFLRTEVRVFQPARFMPLPLPSPLPLAYAVRLLAVLLAVCVVAVRTESTTATRATRKSFRHDSHLPIRPPPAAPAEHPEYRGGRKNRRIPKKRCFSGKRRTKATKKNGKKKPRSNPAASGAEENAGIGTLTSGGYGTF